MDDYYTTNELAFPYSRLLKMGFVGYIFTLRKALGWHFPANDGRRPLQVRKALEISDLPSTIQEAFSEKIQIIKKYEYTVFDIIKHDTIGNSSEYAATLISNDRKNTWTIVAISLRIGTLCSEHWVQNIRTNFNDGTIVITEHKNGVAIPFTRECVKIEILPENVPMSQVLSRHSERVSQKGRSNVIIIPEVGAYDFFKQRAEADFKDLISSGYFRKLSADEVASLKQTSFDFE